MPKPKRKKYQKGGLYYKGVALERFLVNEARAKKGFMAFRSAGSHSPIDVVTIDTKNKEIIFYQVKNWKTLKSKATQKRLEKEVSDFFDHTGMYNVIFSLFTNMTWKKILADRKEKDFIEKEKKNGNGQTASEGSEQERAKEV